MVATPLRAATIEVLVQDEQGTAVPAQMVEVASVSSHPYATSSFERTGESGTASFDKLKPGTYRVAMLASAGFVAPGNNPSIRPRSSPSFQTRIESSWHCSSAAACASLPACTRRGKEGA